MPFMPETGTTTTVTDCALNSLEVVDPAVLEAAAAEVTGGETPGDLPLDDRSSGSSSQVSCVR